MILLKVGDSDALDEFKLIDVVFHLNQLCGQLRARHLRKFLRFQLFLFDPLYFLQAIRLRRRFFELLVDVVPILVVIALRMGLWLVLLA